MKKSLIFLLPLSATSAFCPRGQLQTTTRDSRPHFSAAVSNQESASGDTSPLVEAPENRDQSQQQQPDDNSGGGGVVMSKALPFLPCPPVLRDNNFAGNVGFDPLGLAQTTEQLWHYREAEIKHARLAMLAAAGWPISELCDRQLAAWFGFEPLLDSHDRAPSLFDNWKGLAAVPPAFWGFLFGLTAVIELEYGHLRAWPHAHTEQDPDFFPGKLGLDPLGFYPQSNEGRFRMQLAEIKHGRLAMVAVVIYCLTEYITKEGIVDEFASFFMSTTTGAIPFFPILSPAETLETEFVERFAGME